MLTHTLLQAAQPGGNGMATMLMLGLMMIVFYFFMIRPQAKKVKTEKLFREGIKKGDKIVTVAGIHGKVLEVNDRTMLVEVDTNVKLRMERSAVSMEATKQLEANKAVAEEVKK